MRKGIMFVVGIVFGLIASLGVKPKAKTKVVTETVTEVVTEIVTETVTEVVYIETPAEVSEFEWTDELLYLAKCVQAEAGNQDQLGKRLVVDVILNRVDSSRFPNTIEGVINQPHQFSVVSNGSINRQEPTEDTLEAVRLEIERRTDDDVLFFRTGHYHTFCEPAYHHGAHYFGY